MNGKNTNVQKVAIIGASGAGKTCFIAALRWLGGSDGNCCGTVTRFTNIGASGNSSLYIKTLESSLRQGVVPGSTYNESCLEFKEIFKGQKREHVFSFVLRDYHGESLKTLDSTTSELFKAWSESDYLLVLLDAQSDVCSEKGTGALDDVWDVFSQINPQSKKLAILMTKADAIGKTAPQCQADAMQFFRKHRAQFAKNIDEAGFKKWQCFFIASLGVEPVKKGEDNVACLPASGLKPFGYEALFEWMAENEEMRQIKLSSLEIWRKSWPWLLGITSVLLLWGIVVGIRNYRQEQARFIAENPQSTQQQIAAATHDMKEEDARKFIDERLTELGQEVEKADGDRDLVDKLLKELDDTKAMALSKEENGRLEEIEQTAKVERSRKFKMGIERAYKLEDLETAKKLIAKGFQDNLLLGDDQRWAIETQKAIREKSINDERNAIASIVINSFEDTENLNRKIEKILSFQFEDAGDAQMAKEACADMKKMLENNVFTITGINVGELKAARKTFIILASGKWEDGKWDDREKLKDNPDMYFHTVVKEGVTQWESSDISNAKISWKPGCSLRLEWISKRRWYWPNIAIASHEIPGGWCSLLEMLQRHTLDKIYKDEEYFNGQKPWVEIACEEFPDPAKSLERIKKFIMPGTYWQQ